MNIDPPASPGGARLRQLGQAISSLKVVPDSGNITRQSLTHTAIIYAQYTSDLLQGYSSAHLSFIINGEDENQKILPVHVVSDIVNQTTIKTKFSPETVGLFNVRCIIRVKAEDAEDDDDDDDEENELMTEKGVCTQRVHVGCKYWRKYVILFDRLSNYLVRFDKTFQQLFQPKNHAVDIRKYFWQFWFYMVIYWLNDIKVEDCKMIQTILHTIYQDSISYCGPSIMGCLKQHSNREIRDFFLNDQIQNELKM